MEQHEHEQFLPLLKKTMGAYGKTLPVDDLLDAWLDILKPFPLRVIRAALAGYCDENSEFAPVPAAIAKRCTLLDGRPGAEEAWAIALASRDEADTVVWTTEIAEAFGVCSTVLNTGDEVGARMAFKDAYNRLVTAARLRNLPAQWSVSLGWDITKREAAVTKAAAAGLLPAPQVRALLPNYADPQVQSESSPAGLARVKAEVAKLHSAWDAAAKRREAALKEERVAVAARKQQLAAQAQTYGKQEAMAATEAK